MSVTELASLRLGAVLASSPELLTNLQTAKTAMEEASGFEFHYYHCVEDPNVIYIIGAWPSVEYHMQEFIPGRANQDLLALLKDQVTVEWMFHLDIDQTKRQLPLNRARLAIGRHFIRDGERGRFQKTFDDNKQYLDEFIGGSKQVVGGYRIDKGYDPSIEGDKKEEFVLFTGWDSVERHREFATTDEFNNYAQIRNYIGGADIKHAVKL